MRKLMLWGFVLATLIVPCFPNVPPVWAQAPSVGEIIEPLVPWISQRVVREAPLYVDGQNVCGLNPQLWECGGSPAPGAGSFTIGIDAAGNAYYVSSDFSDFGQGRIGNILRRVSPAGVTEDLARVLRQVCYSEGCVPLRSYGLQGLFMDVTDGSIVMLASAQYCDPNPSCVGSIGIVEISGLPVIQDFMSAGPAGPVGPPGPPGTPADMTLVYALQQTMAAQQTQIDSLKAAVTRIMNLPGMGPRLDKQKPPRQLNPSARTPSDGSQVSTVLDTPPTALDFDHGPADCVDKLPRPPENCDGPLSVCNPCMDCCKNLWGLPGKFCGRLCQRKNVTIDATEPEP